MLRREVRILQIKARSIKTVDYLKNKIVQLKSLVELKQPDVVCICETWLNKNINSDELFDKNLWLVHRKDREDLGDGILRDGDVRGGGVLVAVRKYIKSEHRKDLEAKSPDHNEMVIIELLQSNKKKVGLLTLYRPPSDLNYGFNDNLKHNLDKMWEDGMTEIIVNGDLNFSEIAWSDGYPPNRAGLSYQVASTLQDYGLVQLNTTPSREGCDNILDM